MGKTYIPIVWPSFALGTLCILKQQRVDQETFGTTREPQRVELAMLSPDIVELSMQYFKNASGFETNFDDSIVGQGGVPRRIRTGHDTVPSPKIAQETRFSGWRMFAHRMQFPCRFITKHSENDGTGQSAGRRCDDELR